MDKRFIPKSVFGKALIISAKIFEGERLQPGDSIWRDINPTWAINARVVACMVNKMPSFGFEVRLYKYQKNKVNIDESRWLVVVDFVPEWKEQDA
jgi:hypothetical protein